MSRRHKNKKPKPQQRVIIFHSADRRNIVGAPLPQKKHFNNHNKPTAR